MSLATDPRSDRLYQLLPAIYRVRDEEHGDPLRALLRVISAQVNLVEDDIAQLYDNWFIETCQDWVVPYIGDLLGSTLVADAGLPGTSIADQARDRILMPRQEIANLLRSRRRKGTLSLIEELALSVAGWPARAVEFRRRVIEAQSLNHLHTTRGLSLDLHNGGLLDRLGNPFDTSARTVDVRRPGSSHSAGLYNLPSVGLYIWRLRSYGLHFAPAACIEEIDPSCFSFSVFGNDSPLFTQPVAQSDPTAIAREINLPERITRRELDACCPDPHGNVRPCASAKYYGDDKSFAIWRMVAQRESGDARAARPKYVPKLIPRQSIIVSDLTDWGAYLPSRGTVAVDPTLGRIRFAEEEVPKHGVWVSYHYGFSADIGGGPYARPVLQPATEPFAYFRVAKGGEIETIEAAIQAWRNEKNPPLRVVIEVGDNAVYTERLRIELRHDESLQIRAAIGFRPVVRLLDWRVEGPDVLVVQGEPGSRFALDGIVVSGRNIELGGDLSEVSIRHCTFVPGWALHCECDPKRPGEPSIDILAPHVCLEICHSIVGRIQVRPDVPPIDTSPDRPVPEAAGQMARCSGIGTSVRIDPISIRICDSIIDATSDIREAIGAPGCPVAHARLTILRCTIFGRVEAHTIELGEDSIFTGKITVARRQSGCMRFCSIVPGSRTPRRYRCLPDLVDSDPATRDQERTRVVPRFRSTRFGSPDYARLSDHCASEVLHGAHDESEMGVFHDLFQAQRLALLKARLEEYVPAATDAGVLFAD